MLLKALELVGAPEKTVVRFALLLGHFALSATRNHEPGQGGDKQHGRPGDNSDRADSAASVFGSDKGCAHLALDSCN